MSAQHGGPDPFGRPDPHLAAAAYALGALDPADVTEFERHLAGCPRCAARVAEFAVPVTALAELAPALAADGRPPEPGGAPLVRLLGQVAARRATQRRRRRLATAVAVALIAAGPAAVALTDRPGPAPATAATAATAATTLRAHDPRTGVSAAIGLTPVRWGTRIDLSLSGVDGPQHCRLVAVGRDGRAQTVANWTVPDGGYRSDGRPEVFTVVGSAGLPPADITRFDVLTSVGRRLIDVPV